LNPDQGQNQNVREESSRQVFESLDNERQFIDLNRPYEEENMNIHNEEILDLNQLYEEENMNVNENLDDVQNEKKRFKFDFDLNS